MNPHRKMRRSGYSLALLAAIGVLVAACGPAATEAPPTAPSVEEVSLNFVVWSYSIETIQDNIARFEGETPGVTVNLSDFSWNDYHDTLATPLPAARPPKWPILRITGCKSGWRPVALSRWMSIFPK